MLCGRFSIPGNSLTQSRTFFTRHVYEPRLEVRLPKKEDGTPLELDRKKPVVLLLGWAGARHSYVDKYAQMYNKHGFRTVSFISPCYHYRVPNSRYGFYMSPLFKAIDAKPGDFRNFQDCPIIAHVFSMNGVRSLISLWKWTEAERSEHLRKRITGVIFDSAPALTKAGPDAHAFVQSTPAVEGLEWIPMKLRQKYMEAMFKLRNMVAHPLCYLYPPVCAQLSQFYWLQRYVDLPNSQLFIYSEADRMVRHKYISSFIEHQKRHGKDAKSLKLADSEHVKHFLKYPQAYEAACLDLIARSQES